MQHAMTGISLHSMPSRAVAQLAPLSLAIAHVSMVSRSYLRALQISVFLEHNAWGQKWMAQHQVFASQLLKSW